MGVKVESEFIMHRPGMPRIGIPKVVGKRGRKGKQMKDEYKPNHPFKFTGVVRKSSRIKERSVKRRRVWSPPEEDYAALELKRENARVALLKEVMELKAVKLENQVSVPKWSYPATQTTEELGFRCPRPSLPIAHGT